MAFLALLVTGSGCDRGGKKRPIGFIRLGPAAELAEQGETFISEARILVRYDQGGFSAMSTACTYDLSALTKVGYEGSKRWVSSYSTSSYDEAGKVLKGPARVNLPFYRLQLAAGRYGGPADTLFVEVGAETDPEWRLPWASPQ